MTPDQDGITHINVYSQGRTLLGRRLSNFAHTPFEHPEDGHFESVEGYWYWLSTKDERLRQAHGAQAKRLGRNGQGVDWPEIPGFQDKIRLAITTKINCTPGLAEMLAESALPLAHYYVFDGAVHQPRNGRWILQHIERLRSELKTMPNDHIRSHPARMWSGDSMRASTKPLNKPPTG
jgi:hypothetical protein